MLWIVRYKYIFLRIKMRIILVSDSWVWLIQFPEFTSIFIPNFSLRIIHQYPFYQILYHLLHCQKTLHPTLLKDMYDCLLSGYDVQIIRPFVLHYMHIHFCLIRIWQLLNNSKCCFIFQVLVIHQLLIGLTRLKNKQSYWATQ